MNDLAREKLCELIAKEGQALVQLPLSCKVLLQQHCADCPQEVQALLQVLQQGIATEMIATPGDDDVRRVDDLVDKVRESTTLSDEAARWAIESWAMALSQKPGARIEDHTPELRQRLAKTYGRKSAELMHRHLKLMAVVAVVGGISGAGAWWYFCGLLKGPVAVVYYTVLAAICGTLGASMAWLARGGTTWQRVFASLAGMIVGADMGSMIGARSGFPGGLLFGIFVGSLLGVGLADYSACSIYPPDDRTR